MLRLRLGAAGGECRFSLPVAFATRLAHSRQTMPALRSLRRLPQHHPVMVRGVLVVLLAIVTFASMPKWIAHGHDDAHATASSLAVGTAFHHQHDVAGEPILPLPDGSHAHAHYLAGASATLPSTFIGLCQRAAPDDVHASWRDASTSDGPLTPLHRPPIV